MAEGVPVNVISAALGHSSIATTAQYLAHIQPQEVIDTLRSREWRI
jgi:integrase